MKTMVLAIGGNSLIHSGEKGTISEQLVNARLVAAQIVHLLRRGHRIVLTHGNGPQVGAELLLSERATGIVPGHPLDVCDASTQGEMGYLLQLALHSELKRAGLNVPVVTVVTQCVVSLDDPAMKNPSKPVGRFYNHAEAEERRRQYGWTILMDAERGYRRVVPSPHPLEIMELEVIQRLVNSGALVIACGGGGIPVAWINGNLVGVEAVIDKDLASSLLASKLGCELFVIGTDTDYVYLNYRKPSEQALRQVDLNQLEEYARAGHFPPGSMGPKVESVLQFLRGGGKEAIIAPVEELCAAVEGNAGTHVFPRPQVDSESLRAQLEHAEARR
ncbi:MAG TPA: carbamate kinase [Candidatus Acidoferrum sp.]|nr:carbamate kinase [Candidatus Acidoferrum sp.]